MKKDNEETGRDVDCKEVRARTQIARKQRHEKKQKEKTRSGARYEGEEEMNMKKEVEGRDVGCKEVETQTQIARTQRDETKKKEETRGEERESESQWNIKKEYETSCENT